ESNSYGKKIIFIQPYYLRISNKFGFLIDFRFKKNEDVPFSNSVLRESLSLDKNLRSNRNYYSDKYEILQKFLTENEQLFKSINYHKIKFDINTKLLDMEAGVLEKRTYVFNNNNTHNSQFQGLLNFEPVRKVEGEVQYIFIFEDKFRTF